MKRLILVINPGSTSTKVAVFNNSEEVFSDVVEHEKSSLDKFDRIIDQYELRYKEVVTKLEKHDLRPKDLTAVIGRGGLLKPVESGIYTVNDNMLEYLKKDAFEQHASNLGAIIAYEIAALVNIPSYIADPVVVDEMMDIARITGLPEIIRTSKFHALNQKAIARKAAAELGKNYNDCNMIVVHMGGGLSVGAHEKGKVVDVNEALYGDGPFSAERAGKLPTGPLVDMCFNSGKSIVEIKKRLVGGGGLVAHCGTNNGKEIADKIKEGNEDFKRIFEAMAYQISKEICSFAATLKGNVDAIALTGGMAYSDLITKWITERVEFLAPVKTFPGENEMEAMADAVVRVLDGKEKVKEYK